MITIEDAKILIEIARFSIKNKLYSKEIPEILKVKSGAFVTLFSYPSQELKGCVGVTSQVYSLSDAVTKVAYSAANEDTRFLPISSEEIDNVIIEVSILSKPEKSTFEEISSGDGVIIKRGELEGLFLPQVWKQLLDKQQFFDALCNKASLLPGCWTEKDVEVFKFKVQSFKEEKPNGKIIKEG